MRGSILPALNGNSSGGMLKTAVGCLNSLSFSPALNEGGDTRLNNSHQVSVETVTIFLLFYWL